MAKEILVAVKERETKKAEVFSFPTKKAAKEFIKEIDTRFLLGQ